MAPARAPVCANTTSPRATPSPFMPQDGRRAIVAVGDKPTPHVDALHRYLGSKNVGAALELKLLRNGRVHVQAVELPW